MKFLNEKLITRQPLTLLTEPIIGCFMKLNCVFHSDIH